MPPAQTHRYRVFLVIAALIGLSAGDVGSAQAASRMTSQPPVRAFFVHPDGDDAAAGTSPQQAWRTLARVSRARLSPGDRVRLRGGAAFAGSLMLQLEGQGEVDRPVRLDTYGSGRATIVAGDGTGVYVPDAGGVTIADLRVVGSGVGRNDGDGISFHIASPGMRLRGLRLRNLEVRGFGRWGVAIGSGARRAGYEDVRVSRLRSHRNGLGGLLTYAAGRNIHRGVHVSDSAAYRNAGVPGLTTHSGSGIVLGGVNRASVRRSVAHHNGGRNDALEGGVGIWAYDSTRVLIERNRSYANRTGGPSDGGGFDLDHNVSASVVQHNISYDNDGAGYFLHHGPNTDEHVDNVVQHNLSRNDGRRNGYGGIRIRGRNPGTTVRSNRVELMPAPDGQPAALQLFSPHAAGLDGVAVRDNVFVARRGAALVQSLADEADPEVGLLLSGNRYESAGGAFLVRWGGQEFMTLASWKAWRRGRG